MRRRCLLAAAFLVMSSSVSLFAQLRSLVPVVRPVFHKETIAFLESLSESMRSDGYQDAADSLKAFAQSGFGSGFVYVAQDSANYVITNRHVVAQAESATLEFERDDGSTTVYKNCPVVMVDEALDLALVAFPPGTKPFTQGFPMSVTGIEDGLDVWSAGFPGILDRPTWQLGKGNVTNSRARVPELADPAVTTLIQHSAQIDPGNSGGPLVVSDPSSPVGYSVVGVNTWKIVGRQATNFAIPSAAVMGFVGRALQPSASTSGVLGAALESRSRDFISAVSTTGEDAYKNVVKFVSYELASREGEAALKEALATAPTRVRNDIGDVFVGVSPVEGLRMAVALAIQQQLSAGGIPVLGFVAIDGEPSDSSLPVPVRLSRNGADLPTSWLREHGTWRLAALPMGPSPKKEKGGTAAFSIESPYRLFIKVEAWVPLPSSSTLLGGGILAPFLTYVAIGLSTGISTQDYTDEWGYTSTTIVGSSQFYGRVQVPLRFSGFAVIPYVMAGAGTTTGFSATGEEMSFIYGVGLEAGFGSSPGYYAGLEWQGETHSERGSRSFLCIFAGMGL